MAATDIDIPGVPLIDDVDDSLFDYDVGDVFRDVDTNMDAPAVQRYATIADGKENGAGLGIDEEIKVTKKRVPVPKLDENRLLSPAGIPKLRRIAKERLRFKGKGHEYSDVARLLNLYQLWLDDLYPRAKFADGLAIIEKLGHTKRMQTMRRGWINEGKPHEISGCLGEGPAGQKKSEQDRLRERPRTPIDLVGDKNDLYVATPRSTRDDETTEGSGDTETLFLEDPTKTVPMLVEESGSPAREENFDDEEEVLLALHDVW